MSCTNVAICYGVPDEALKGVVRIWTLGAEERKAGHVPLCSYHMPAICSYAVPVMRLCCSRYAPTTYSSCHYPLPVTRYPPTPYPVPRSAKLVTSPLCSYAVPAMLLCRSRYVSTTNPLPSYPCPLCSYCAMPGTERACSRCGSRSRAR
eukprot:3245256-Rhodomonas_salina.4